MAIGREHGGDPDVLARALPRLYQLRDSVLDDAAIEAGETVLDLGTGNGLLGFGAIDRVGGTGKVIASRDELLRQLVDAVETDARAAR